MKPRDTSNPHNRFHDRVTEYEDGEAPPASAVTVIDDHSRSILSENDSPDVGFRWSVNPYRGCQHACAYCMEGDTLVLLADGGTRKLAELRTGDAILGTRIEGSYRRLVRTHVLDHWRTRRLAHRVTLANGTSLVASGDHRFLSNRGWRFVTPHESRPFLTTTESLTSIPHAAAIGDLIDATPLGQRADTRVVAIDVLDTRELFDITTGTGDFIANGVVSHNCYARPSHEYLDLGAGTDFDTKIVVKRRAPELLRAAFDKPSWKGELVMFSGVTDCYQPVEKELQLTRGCLEVCREYRNPCSVISKSALVERDIDLFLALAKDATFGLSVSLAFSDNDLARAIEPWAPSPDRRFKVIEKLAAAGVPVGVMCAPIIPGINDSQMVTVLERAAAAGATWAGWVLLRLPGAVKEVFEDRVRVALPLAADKVLHRIRETRGGEKLYDSRFGVRGRGEGPYAETIKAMFDATVLRLGLNQREDPDERTTFRRPEKISNQLKLF